MSASESRPLGRWKGRVRIADDLDALLPDATAKRSQA